MTMRDQETDRRVPPPVDGDELDDIRSLLDDDTIQDGADFSIDDILSEYSGVSDVLGNTPEDAAQAPDLQDMPDVPDVPAYSDSDTQRIERISVGAQKPVQTVHTSAAPMQENEEPDVRQTISAQVNEVMEEKQTGTPKFKKSSPPSKPRHHAVHVTDEYDGTPPPQPASKSKPAGPVLSDDLRSFRGLTPADALAKARSAVGYYKWRCVLTFLLALLSGYITAAPSYGLPLPSFISYIKLPFIYLFILSALQLIAMFICVSLLADGLRMLARRRFKAETLIFLVCLVNLLYTMQIMVKPELGGWLPYHCVVILTLFFGMLTRALRYEGIVRACYALSFASGRYTPVNGVRSSKGKVKLVYKLEPAPLEKRLMDRLWEEDRIEHFMYRFSPFVFIATAVFALIASVSGTGKISFLWAWSGLLSVSLPGGLLAAAVMPYASVAGRLAHFGTVLAGPRSAELLSETRSVILQERDIFPTKMVSISAVKVFSGFTPEKINLCTLAVLKASGSGLYHALTASLSKAPVNMPLMENFEFYETGGMGAFVNSDRVLVGTANFILRSGVRIPEGINLKNGIFVAVNMQFAGLYPVKYDVMPSVRRALVHLTRRHLTPVLAVRDFNITPQLVESRFKLNPDSLGYPDLNERINYSSYRDGLEDEPIAALAVDSTVNFADAVSSGRRVHTAVRINLILGLIAAILGIGLNFFLLIVRAPSAITPFNVAYYTLLWFIPPLIVSFGANRR